MATTNKRKTEPSKPSVEEEVAKYGTTIPSMLRGILTELVRARIERG